MCGYSIYEIADEITSITLNGESIRKASLEILLVVVSLFALLYFTIVIIKQQKSHANLESRLNKVRKNLESANIKLQDGKKEFSKVIQWQFKQWQLSPSESDVALLLLKGLSFKEIAEARATHVKTVRKQASSIYEKSGLTGRHELSAWFFEDML
jgi:DNA-binding NarL/FixJ family response regulator